MKETDINKWATLIFENMVQSAKIESKEEYVYYRINLCYGQE